MEPSNKSEYLQNIIEGIDLTENLKIRAVETEIEAHKYTMEKIISEQCTVAEEPRDLNIEIRKLQLSDLKHTWEDSAKVLQAKHDKWGKKEFHEKLENITHNYNYLMEEISSEEYEAHLEMIQKVAGYEEKIETLIEIFEKNKEREEYLKNLPKPKSFLSKIAKRNKKLDQKVYKTNEQIIEEKRKKRLELEKEQRLKAIEEHKEKKEQQKKEKEEFEQAMAKSSRNIVPLYKKLEKRFKQKVLMPELEKKKEKLQTLRNMHKPVDYEQLREHARSYSQKRAETLEKHREEREKKILENLQNQQNLKIHKHKSMFMLNVLEQEQQEKESDLIKSAELHNLYDKRKNYGELVKQMYKPEISRKKQIEMKIQKAKLKHIPKANTIESLHSEGRRLSPTSSGRLNSPNASVGKSEYRNYFSENSTLKPIRRWKENEMKPMTKPKLAPIVTDYLLEKRKIREEKSTFEEDYGEKKKKPIEWKSLVEKMSQKEKIEYLKVKAQQIEEKAHLQDEKNTIEFDAKAQAETDDMLIDALKARITALEDVTGS
ncbi:unnamed protein product [Moneuplotes crassus]|uniref:Uncharacterized protein n=1 Tax=Euplotes crassus TaxID=5936 RepID=A0AAD1X527_EUPCR|nr:unnamed protein product [Moneuplotes crassus]